MAKYKVTDNQTGKTITFDWHGDGVPAESDMEEVFAGAREMKPSQPAAPDARTVEEQTGIPPKLGPGAIDTLKNIGKVYPAIETAANLATSAYGVPISGLAGALSLPLEAGKKALGLTDRDPFSASSDVVRDLQSKLIYQPQTEGGKQLTEAATYPLAKLEELAGSAGGKLEEAGYPNLGAATHSAIAGAPALIPGLRKAAKSIEPGRAAMDIIKPSPSPETALKQVLQGKTKDFAKGKEAISAIDTEGIKTYPELNQRINAKIKDYAELVDNELSMDSGAYPLSDLVTKTKTPGGEVVTQNHVVDALSHLKEMYEKINDPAKAKAIEQILTKAEEEGLTKKQVNDISRTYGNEFGDKAFSPKSGEPLTSINARAYENTRKGLKETAREGMGPEAKELDATLSSMINTRRLIEKNIEAVNRLQQRVDPRSLGEKVGRAVGYALDWASGGTIKGLVGKFLPRGVGNKVMNALDLEEALSRNLKILREAEKGKLPPDTGSWIGTSGLETKEEPLLLPMGTMNMPEKTASILEAERALGIGSPLIRRESDVVKSPTPMGLKSAEGPEPPPIQRRLRPDQEAILNTGRIIPESRTGEPLIRRQSEPLKALPPDVSGILPKPVGGSFPPVTTPPLTPEQLSIIRRIQTPGARTTRIADIIAEQQQASGPLKALPPLDVRAYLRSLLGQGD